MIRDSKFCHNLLIHIVLNPYDFFSSFFFKGDTLKIVYAVVFYNRLNRGLLLTQSYGKDSEDLK